MTPIPVSGGILRLPDGRKALMVEHNGERHAYVAHTFLDLEKYLEKQGWAIPYAHLGHDL